MTSAEIAFALDTADLTLGAAAACAVAAFLAGTVAVVHVTSAKRPPRTGWIVISLLAASCAALAVMTFNFWTLP